MSTLLCLNELSCECSLRPDQVDTAMRDFVGALKHARRVRPGTALISPARLPRVELAAGYPMERWVADARNKDLWRFVRSMQNRAPFTFDEVAPSKETDEVEYLHDGRVARGLGVAHLVEGLAVSLPTEPAWSAERVTATRNVLVETGDLLEEEVDIRHASCAEHMSRHESWLTRGGLYTVDSGAKLWTVREEYFPALTFLPRVESDLQGLPANWLIPVRNRLAELQRTVSAWDHRSSAVPLWESLVTPEHEQRKRLCEFVDLDGQVRVFDWHARFTPGAGRVHFRLVRGEGRIRIAYIGRKLGV